MIFWEMMKNDGNRYCRFSSLFKIHTHITKSGAFTFFNTEKRIIDAETSFLSAFQVVLPPIYHEKTLQRQGFRVFLKKNIFLKIVDYQEYIVV
jgi:hypothetical protein